MVLKQNNNASQAPDGSNYVTLTDGAGNLASAASSGFASPTSAGATVVSSSSGNVAAAAATATLAAAVGKTTYIVGAIVTGSGATAGSVVNGTITGLLGGTMTFSVPVSTGVTAGNQPIYFDFYPALPASTTNTAIVVSVPSLGAGNTNSAVSAWGYQL